MNNIKINTLNKKYLLNKDLQHVPTIFQMLNVSNLQKCSYALLTKNEVLWAGESSYEQIKY